MPSGNAEGTRLSLMLVLLMILPSSIALMQPESLTLGEEISSRHSKQSHIGSSETELGTPDYGDPSHGWEKDIGNIGQAFLHHRTATYIPIQNWGIETGEREIRGWHALGHHYPIPSDWISDLQELGIVCKTFFAPQGFHCNVPGLTPSQLMEAGVIGAFRLDDTDKLAPDVIPLIEGYVRGEAIMEGERFVMSLLLSGHGHYNDLIETGVDVRDFRLDRFADVVVDVGEIGLLTSLNFVEWIEPNYPSTLDNDIAADYVNANWVHGEDNWQCRANEEDFDEDCSTGSQSLSGAGIIVAVMDSGFDNVNECNSLSQCTSLNPTVDEDVRGRIWGVVNRVGSDLCGGCPTDGPEDENGHGTHVVGSILGDGSNSEDGRGIAYGAYLFMQSVGYIKSFYGGDACGGQNGCIKWGLENPAHNVAFQEAHDAGARVSSNSWGRGPDACVDDDVTPPYNPAYCWNYYSSDTLLLDNTANNLDDLTILFAMGNDAMDCSYSGWGLNSCPTGKDGEISLGAMNRQATAKNIISVGASESFQPGLGSTYNTNLEFGAASPMAADYQANNPHGMWGSSNRGPTDDGRIKPDIVAPGSYIKSICSSELATEAPNVYACSAGDEYTFKSGTSMATPITAGSVALLIEHLNSMGYDCNLAIDPSRDNCPESALIKAILVAGALDMIGQYSSGGDGENGAAEAAPNNHEGWGRVDLQGSTGSAFTSGIDMTTGESHSFRLTIPDTGLGSFRIALAWNDPGNNSPVVEKQLVNDLDIALKDPTGATWSYTNDDLNNLVGITVDNPDAGDWEVIVTGTNVPFTQKYYLAASSGTIEDMRHPVSDGLNEPGFQAGSIFTETTMTSGGSHICSVFDDSSLRCWGDNSFGQLGDGTTTDRLTMTEVSLEEGRTAVSISAGKEHTCAILDNGEIVCWGRNNFGQLGDGSNGMSSSPVGVAGFGGAGDIPVQISSGDSHSCAILDDASLKCWGRNVHGQLGDLGNSDSNVPVSVSLSGQKVLAISAGSNHTCAVINDWTLNCWGANDQGQLGVGSDVSSSTPSSVSVGVGVDVVAVSLGESHTCALLANSDMKCWGGNSHGQLGDGGTGTQNLASSVSASLSGVTSIETGQDHTCATDASKNLHCWGSSSKGQVGDGSTSSQVTSPSSIDLGQSMGALSISAGSSFTCVVASNDLPKCWGGQGSDLALGTSPEEFSTPRWAYVSSSERDLNLPPDGVMNIFEVNVADDGDGDGFPGADDSDNSNPTVAVNCGPGSYGRFTCREAAAGYYVEGSGNTVMTAASPGNYTDEAGEYEQTPCGIGTFQELSGQTSCDDALPGYYVPATGASKGTPCPAGKFNDLPAQTSESACNWADAGHSVPVLTQVSAGALHTCSILDDGSVKCWGDNSFGQLGDGTRTDHSHPERATMPIGKRALDVAAGSYHNCVLLDEGSVRCWGDNSFGQLGDGTTIERTTPVVVNLGAGKAAIGISAGESHTCAVLDDGSMKCWGENSNGQLGDGSTSDRHDPVAVIMGGSEVHSVYAGSYHTCAIMVDRTVRCWGDNWLGQLGDGTTADRMAPVEIQIPSNSSAVTMDSGPFHTCVGMNDGTMYCWGFNVYGQLGNGVTTNANTPAAVALDSTQAPTQVFTGLFHTCALFDSGEMACWGDNSVGQLGIGNSDSKLLPHLVTLPNDALSISVGHRHTCSILDDATLNCWGINSEGQIGDGGTTDSQSPVVVNLRHGSKEQVPCSPGTYQPNGSQTSCLLADRGYKVPLSGQLNQTGCTRGEFSGLKGQEFCTQAGLGFYVEGFFAVSQTPCPEGQSTLEMGSNNPDSCLPDFDGDKLPDQFDNDADNDGVINSEDFDWLDPNVSVDSDRDSIPDSLDPDDDNDGVNDTEDLFPNDQSEWKDNDLDGVGDNADKDDDGDGRNDIFDVFPDDPEEWSDFDGDEIGDNADQDDDNDGMCDGPTSSYSGPPDVDNDGQSDCTTLPNGDAFPLDSLEWFDTDGDSIGNVADTDDDGDGYEDSIDAFSLDATEWSDSDSDNIGDNRDAFPNDSSEWLDTDADGIGDNTDQCPYVAGINPLEEGMMILLALPGNEIGCPVSIDFGDEIPEEEDEEAQRIDIAISDTADFDGDGEPDLIDDDDDNDGIKDSEDGELDPLTGTGQWSKDPGRPFGVETWVMIVASVSFVGLMGYRIAGMKNRNVSLLKSKRIRIQ